MLQLPDGERISLGKYTLLALVLVFFVDVFEENRVAGRVQRNVDAGFEHLLNRFFLCWVHCRDE